MKTLRLALGLLGLAAAARATDDVLDRVDDALAASAWHDQLRVRLSGTLDLEEYAWSGPAPALIHADGRDLLVPRLSLFVDAQLGSQLYFFAQSRADRGFDPDDQGMHLRLDEYALRYSPGNDARLNLQIGKFATIVGSWTPRHNSWSNPFVTAPLPYENLTGIWDAEALRAGGTLLQWSHVRPGLPAGIAANEKYLRLPIVWGPSYATGAAVSGELGKFRYALEMKNAALSSHPEAWTRTRGTWAHPTVSARAAYAPNPMWTFGASASAGPYLRPLADATLPPGRGRGDYRQLVAGQDVSFAWHRVQLWSEIYAARFELPGIGHADTLAYYVEAKYKFTPQLFGALRWNEQLFGAVPDRGAMTRWGRDVARLDLAAGYRFTPHTQLKVQLNLQDGDTGGRAYGELFAVQCTVRF